LQKQFGSNIILLLLINLLIKPIYILGIDAQVQNQLGDKTYGIYFALFNFCFLFQVILDFGIQNFNSRRLSQNRELITEEFPFVLGTKVILFVLFLLLVFLTGIVIGYPAHYRPILIGVGVFIFLQGLYVYLRSHFSILGFYRRDALLSAVDKLLMILILGYFLYWVKEINILLFIKCQIAALIVSCLIALIGLMSLFKVRMKFSIGRSMSLLKKSWPFALVILLMTLYTRMDGVMLERLLDDDGKAAGVYAAGFRLLDAANILGYLFAMLLLPMYSKLLADREDVFPLLRSALGMILTLSTITSVACYFFAAEIMSFIYDEVSASHVLVFRILMMGFWFMSLAYIYGTLITASGKLKAFNLIFVLGIVCNWGLNLYLIPLYQAEGAATATLITQGMVCLGQILLATRRHKLDHGYAFILKIISFMGITFASFYMMSIFLPISWYLQAILASVFLAVVSFLLGLFRLNWIVS